MKLHMPEFTTKWFQEETLPLWRKHLVPRGPVRSYVESGVYEGASLLWVFENLLTTDGYAVGIDPFVPKRRQHLEATAAVQERCRRNLAGAVSTGRLELIERRSQDVLLEWCAAKHAPLDVVFLDGEHEAVPCLEDMVCAWRLLRVGGVLICDDLDYRWIRRRPRVWEAVTAFEWAYERRFETLYRTRKQVAYLKVQ